MPNYSKLSANELKEYIANSNAGSPALVASQKELEWRRKRLMFLIGTALSVLSILAAFARLLWR